MTPLLQKIGWVLLVFLWQGTLVAAALALVLAAVKRRRPELRYAICCAAFLLMLALPVATFFRRASGPDRRDSSPQVADSRGGGLSASQGPALSSGLLTSPSFLPPILRGVQSLSSPLGAAWLIGVLLLSLRLLAGWATAQTLRRRGVSPAPERVQEAFRRIARKLAVSRPVVLVQSAAVAVPTALGAFKPVILLPVCAVTGLGMEELEAVLAHELAHIRRHDYAVNLMQAVAETLLFYHPAVWWVSGRIREERENCCDDLAVAATGDTRVYVRALVHLEGFRAASPAFAVAATGGVLWSRVARLLSAPSPTDRASRSLAGALALAILFTLGASARVWTLESSAVSSGENALHAPARRDATASPATKAPPAAEKQALRDKIETAIAGGIDGGIRGGVAGAVKTVASMGIVGGVAGGVPGGVEGGIEGGVEGGVEEEDSGALPASLDEGGPAATLSPDQLASFRTHGVTPEFLAEIVRLGYTRASVDELIGLRIHGVTPEYISRMTQLFGKVSLDECVSLRIHGVTPEFVQGFREAGYRDLSADDAVSLRIHGVQPGDAAELEKVGGRKLSQDELLSARIHGVTPAFAGEMRALGLEADSESLVSFRIHGVTPDFVRAVRSLGYAKLSGEEAVAMLIHGVTADFAAQIQALGYKDVSIDELTSLRIHGVTPDFIRRANRAAAARISIEELIDMRTDGRNPR